mmetsp:Transcript_14564/g.16937  ORF Transcript_14564/g.16937 Transcript_14564/m.16937 type:complete len:386 (-) Transcript_14564:43-1200(-)
MRGITSILLSIIQGNAIMTGGDKGNSATTTIILKDESKYCVRPYDSNKDRVALEQICKDVWKGTDYLPSMAKQFELDESCDFVVMQNEQEDVVALGNRKIFDISMMDYDDNNIDDVRHDTEIIKSQRIERISWIEAIRTSKEHMGKGLATALIQALIKRSYDDGITDILSCTIESNDAMKKVFDRNCMKLTNKMCFLSFGKLATLPGWKVTDHENNADTLIRALKVEHLFEEHTRTTKWTPVESEMELNTILKQMKTSGGLGLFPGLGKPYFIDQQIRENLKKGLIQKLEDKEKGIIGLYALVQDVAIQSLKSKWVCSIISFDSITFDSALWDSCSESMVLKRGGDAAFVVVYDNCLSNNLSSSSIMDALPIQKNDSFILFSSNE